MTLNIHTNEANHGFAKSVVFEFVDGDSVKRYSVAVSHNEPPEELASILEMLAQKIRSGEPGGFESGRCRMGWHFATTGDKEDAR